MESTRAEPASSLHLPGVQSRELRHEFELLRRDIELSRKDLVIQIGVMVFSATAFLFLMMVVLTAGRP